MSSREPEHSTNDDEEYARYLQFQEQLHGSRHILAQRSLSSRQQEARDMELARHFAKMEFEGRASVSEQASPENHRFSSPDPTLGTATTYESPSTCSTTDGLPIEATRTSVESWNASASARNQCEHRRSRSIDEPLEYARMLQARAFAELDGKQRARPVLSPPSSDLELARRLQDLEDMGMPNVYAGTGINDQASLGAVDESLEGSFGLIGNTSFASTRSSQDDDDERIARFMQESGTSIRDLSEAEVMELLERATSSHSSYSRRSAPVGGANPQLIRSLHDVGESNAAREAIANISILTSVPTRTPSSPNSRIRPHVPRATVHSAPTTPTRQSPSSIPNLSSMPMLDPWCNASFSDPRSFADRRTKKRRPRGFLGFGSRNERQSPGSPNIHSASKPTIPRWAAGSPRSIPSLPSGNLASASAISTLPSAQRSQLKRPPSPGSLHTSENLAGVSTLCGNAHGPVVTSTGVQRLKTRSLSPTPNGSVQPGSIPHSLSGAARNFQHAKTVPRAANVQSPTHPSVCKVCKKGGGAFVVAIEAKYHVDCFRCASCNSRIDPLESFAVSKNDRGPKHPYHPWCYAAAFGVRCAVCKQPIPAQEDGSVSFVKHPFFGSELMCPYHTETSRRCTGCNRFEPDGEPFADLHDAGRCVCYSCCRTVIVDNADVEPLWRLVLSFFENTLGLPVWDEMRRIPVLAVQSDALNDQMNIGTSPHFGSSQIMARGLCLTDHRHRRMFKLPSIKFEQRNGSFEALDVEERGFTYFELPESGHGNPNSNVFAILCLSGLPRALTTSILAHEATHAWIKLHPHYDSRKPLPPQVEEGCAQLVAMLLLSDGPPDTVAESQGGGPSDEKLRQYFKFSIERDDNEIYGAGYRKAALAYSNIGIEALLSHVVRYREFPKT